MLNYEFTSSIHDSAFIFSHPHNFMTGKTLRQEAFLRLVASNSSFGQPQQRYSLLTDQEVAIGRDLRCQIVLDSSVYGMVSRRHAVVRSLPPSPEGKLSWLICDENSANGTYLNGQRLHGCQELHPGDRITLGPNGAEFIFEYQVKYHTSFNPAPAVAPAVTTVKPIAPPPPTDGVSLSQLFPILSTGKDLPQKAYLIPGIVTVVFVILMFATVGKAEAAIFNQRLVGIYLASAAYYFVYQLCGKHKPWWVLMFCAVATMALLRSPVLDYFVYIFRDLLPGDLPQPPTSVPFPTLLVRMFFGAGMMEELLKALPILAVYLIAQILPSPWRERIGIVEPLDGILLGTASAVGFTLLETLGQYVPEFTNQIASQSGAGAAPLAGLQLLIPRILGSVSGHMAYSGYFGYFIGLSVLKPRHWWQILMVGFLTASTLHALWNATGVLNALVLAVVGVLSYAFLTAAILKARALSPTRANNFATRFVEKS